MRKNIAVVTGANKGIGFGVAKALAEKSYKVLLLGRDGLRSREAADKIKSYGLDVEAFVVDVADSKHVEGFATEIKDHITAVDVLINNAGVILEGKGWEVTPTIESVDPEIVLQTININTIGAMRMVRALLPLLKRAPAARIVNISSGMGGIAEMEGGWPGYRMSKAALNALTKIVAAETVNTRIKVNSVCPGWVRTDMGGRYADRSIEQAVPGIVWAAELPADGPSGGFFRDGKPIAW